MDNVARAARAFGGFERSIGHQKRSVADYLSYFNSLSDRVVLRYSVPADSPMDGEFRGKEAVVQFTVVTAAQLLADVRLTSPLTYISDGDRVCVLGQESYTVRRSGATVENRAFATMLDFAGGLITRIFQFKDMSELVAAHWSTDGQHDQKPTNGDSMI